MHARQVVFYAPKHGNAEAEWEDGAAAAPADNGRGPRFAVADGATQGFGSARWAQRLVAGFVGAGSPAPALDRASLHRWARHAQDDWRADPRVAGATPLQRHKMEVVGSFATFVGCELRDLGGPRPRWTAVALGDAVLFHVRGQRLVGQFPAMAAEDFGSNPDGVPTTPDGLADVVGRVLFAEGDLADGDVLYLATDAFAQWVVATGGPALWSDLASLEHPDAFRSLVADRRAAREMVNDDVTLLRVLVDAAPPEHLVVCL
ncbi:hypothetical protein [Saccharothrix sp. Mg75]|uniref:hypothetical protein n=1 Tax=Saccharothrix sp. Mg75 TaxID=3445357 RepID=UPI003EE9ACE9